MVSALLAGVGGATAANARPAARAPTIATITIPGDPRFVAIVRDGLLAQTEHLPDFASQSRLFDDAVRVPSFAPEHIAPMTRRLRNDMTRLRALPWRSWSVDEQIDLRWMYANAERVDRELNVEQLWRHRPGAWLEPLANNYIAILTYAPTRTELLAAITAQVPAMVAAMRTPAVPTQADAELARDLVDGIVSMLRANPGAKGDAAIASLLDYRKSLDARKDAAPFAVIGAANDAWRLKRASLLPWSPAALLALAEQRIAWVDGELAALTLPAPAPLPKKLEQAALDQNQASLLALYDRIQVHHRAAIEVPAWSRFPPASARCAPA